MSLGLRLSLDIISGEFQRAVEDFSGNIAEASTDTMDEVLGIVKREGRADIKAAGFGTRWQNALRVNRYPKKGVSIDAAVFVNHKISYAEAFEDGATIKGDPLLWLPLSTVPPTLSGRMTRPERLNSILGGGSKLVAMGNSKNGTPLLGARLRLSRTAAKKSFSKVTLAALKRGDGEGTGVLRTVPLFFGVRQTKLPKKLSIREVCARAQDRIPALYAIAISKVL